MSTPPPPPSLLLLLLLLLLSSPPPPSSLLLSLIPNHKVNRNELKEMQRILDEEVPILRRLAAPVTWSYPEGQEPPSQ